MAPPTSSPTPPTKTSVTPRTPLPHPHPDSSTPPGVVSPPPHRQLPLVDLRMIDFAHSTFKGFRGDTAVHDGPDRGYMLGLESLIEILESLREENLP